MQNAPHIMRENRIRQYWRSIVQRALIPSVNLADSDYGQLSLETWRFLHDIYGGGPVFYTEGEKDNEEKRDQQEQDEQVQQE